nr:putative polyprotein [Tanacetum cinerariifolium]
MSPTLQKQFESYRLGKSVSAHVLEMKGYMDQLHALGKSYDNDMAINLINRSLNKDFGDFVRNFNMHCVGKTMTELHAQLIDYEKGLKDKAPTPQVLTKQKGRENKPKPQANKKDKSKGKTDKNKKVVPYQPKPKHNPLKRKENPNKDPTCHHCHVFKSEVKLQLGKKIKALRSDRGGKYLSQEFKDYLRYPKETMGYYFYFPHENKVIVARYGNFLERDLISQKFSGRDNDLEDDHMETLPSENTSKISVQSESLGSPPELIPVRRSERTTRAPNRLCLNIEVKDDEVGDLGEHANYKAAMLDPDKVIWQDIRAIRILIAIVAYYDYKIWQMDVKTAFLNGRLDEDICMEQPEGYVDPKYPNCKYNMHNSKKGYLPMEVKHDLSNELCASTPKEVAYIKKVTYASAIGSIMYAVRCTRPDVAFGQKDMFLVYGGKPDTELVVTSFCDASWQCDKDDTKSKTGYVFVINGGAVDWKSKKQTTIAMHSAQAEYVDASEAAIEAV